MDTYLYFQWVYRGRDHSAEFSTVKATKNHFILLRYFPFSLMKSLNIKFCFYLDSDTFVDNTGDVWIFVTETSNLWVFESQRYKKRFAFSKNIRNPTILSAISQILA